MFARLMTTQVKPGQLQAVTNIYLDKILPVLEQQAGFNQLLVLRNPETDQEMTVCIWDSLEEMNAFSRRELSHLMNHFMPLIAAAPTVEIFQVCCQSDARPLSDHIQLGETSLGVRIEDETVAVYPDVQGAVVSGEYAKGNGHP